MELTRPNSIIGPKEHFTGNVKLEALKSEPIKILRVSFDAGSRTFWHKHPSGQTLYIVSGTARVGFKDESGNYEMKDVSAGEIVVAAPNERHWHGASPDGPMVHIAIQEDLEWESQEVSDAEYSGSV